MAVFIRERDLRLRDMAGSDIAYDVRVRKVFLRTRLANRYDMDHMVRVARAIKPEQPGAELGP